MEKIVTKDWLRERLVLMRCPACGGSGYFPKSDNWGGLKDCETCKTSGRVPSTEEDSIAVLGRALLAIYRRQTESEKTAFATKYANGIGFSGPDAKLGSRCAEYFQKNGTLAPWMAKVWLVEKAGYPRICKYAKQLNEIANEKQQILKQKITLAESLTPKY